MWILESTYIFALHMYMFSLLPALLTSIILWRHGPVQDLFEGVQPLFLFPLLLAHEDKLPLGCPHHDTALPFVSPSMLWDILLNRVAFALCADENYPQLLCVLHTYNKENSSISNIIEVVFIITTAVHIIGLRRRRGFVLTNWPLK